MVKNTRILVIDDDQGVLYTAKMILRQHYGKLETAGNPATALELIKKEKFDIVILDMNFRSGATSGQEGINLLKKIKKLRPDTHIIIDTAFGDIDLAVKTMKEGALDFLTKPWEKEKLLSTVNNAYNQIKSKQEVKNLRSRQKELLKNYDREFGKMIASDESMKKILNIIEKVATTDANILILGENGTGKELVARRIHDFSPRADKPFIKVDLGAIPETLFESELFGHEKGAFTDAKESKTGRFELADEGTLFLDEIANLNLQMQAKLLSVIQNKSINRLGATETIPIDTRLICATNMDIDQEVINGNFRRDLLYRINTVVVEIPPLRERVKDIPLLLDYYLKRYEKKYNKHSHVISENTYEDLMNYHWPGNIRELKHSVERAVIMSEENEIRTEDFAIGLKSDMHQTGPSSDEPVPLDDMERNAIQDAISKYNGNLSVVAQKLGLGRTTLYRKIKKYKLKT